MKHWTITGKTIVILYEITAQLLLHYEDNVKI